MVGHESPPEPRRRPRQARAQRTVEAIVEAGARVFAERGYAGSTTNHIALRAGVSVGSLYEYFPNKDAILAEVADRHVQRMIGPVIELLDTAEPAPEGLPDWLDRFVERMLAVHLESPELHRLLLEEAPHHPAIDACVLQMETSLAHRVRTLFERDAGVSLRDPDTAAHLVVQTVEALTHRFAHHGIHELSPQAFVAEVTRLLAGYLERSRRGA
ncbi:MAG: TetR/AcrR family transcriptional regulator [Proteobacteria bacterium]|nr:TetR/AcrR family transcriptional regulator [Pseudomonadota bacterium]